MDIRSARRTTRAGLLLAGVGAALVTTAGAASAHVTVQPGSVEGGDFSVVAVRVPNERDDASTTKVRLVLPVDQPLGSVQTTPIPGWRVTTASRNLDEPLDFFGSKLSSVTSEVTWTATDGGIRPGQFQDFPVSLGQLPKSGDLVFKALQTYSSGEKVAWNQVAVDNSAEPEHPAPALTLTAPAADSSSAGAENASQATTAAAGTSDETADSGGESSSALPIGLSVVALVTALAALGVGLKRRTG